MSITVHLGPEMRFGCRPSALLKIRLAPGFVEFHKFGRQDETVVYDEWLPVRMEMDKCILSILGYCVHLNASYSYSMVL